MLLHVRPGHTLAVPCPLARTSLMHWSWALYSQGLRPAPPGMGRQLAAAAAASSSRTVASFM